MDDLCIGRPELDLVPTQVEADRFGRVAEFRAMERNAGKTLSQWGLSRDACRIREITMVTWLGTLWNDGEDRREEFQLRMETLMNASDTRRWGSI